MTTAFRPGSFPTYLLEVRKVTSIRAELRQAAHAALEPHSYRHLCPWWEHDVRLKDPVLMLAAAAAEFGRLKDSSGSTLGRIALRMTLGPDGVAQGGVESKLMIIQRLPLRKASRYINSLLALAEQRSLGLDWNELWRTYRDWDDTSIANQRQARRRVITDFYSESTAHHTKSKSKVTESEEDK